MRANSKLILYRVHSSTDTELTPTRYILTIHFIILVSIELGMRLCEILVRLYALENIILLMCFNFFF